MEIYFWESRVAMVSYVVYYDTLLQNVSAFLLQNVTVLLQNATVITKYIDFITRCVDTLSNICDEKAPW